jgi:2-keto-4-pentenoate hydratase
MSATEFAVAAIAARQWRDYCARTPGTYFADAHEAPLDLQQAYAIQRAVAAIRVDAGDSVVGFKVGCTGPGTTAQFGMQGPIRGYLFGGEVYRSGITLDPTTFASLAIEGEMAVRIGSDGAIAAAFPIIELHNFVFRAPRKTLAELVANNGLNAGIVAAADDAAGADLAPGTRLGVRINGHMVDESGLWPLPGGAEASLDWLRRDLARDGLALAPGQIVITGTPLGLYPVHPGDTIETCVDGVPRVTCSIAAPTAGDPVTDHPGSEGDPAASRSR